MLLRVSKKFFKKRLMLRSLYCIVICSKLKLLPKGVNTGILLRERLILKSRGYQMSTITKKDLIDRISDATQAKRVVVKRIVQYFLDEIVTELAADNRLEFRDFGVFETRSRTARVAQNPKTLERVKVPSKRSVKFKMGRLLKEKLSDSSSLAESRDAD
jgi:integration host factor subunit beta